MSTATTTDFTWPATPVIPDPVCDGGLITADQTNDVIQCLSDLWTNMQALAATVNELQTAIAELRYAIGDDTE